MHSDASMEEIHRDPGHLSGDTPELAVAAYMTKAPHLVDSHAPLPDALKVMRAHGIRHLPVTQAGALVGILSKHDVILMTPLASAPPAEVSVEDVMSDDPYTVSPATPLGEVVQVMAERGIGAAIVVEGEAIVGVFTTIDALRALAAVLDGRRR